MTSRIGSDTTLLDRVRRFTGLTMAAGLLGLAGNNLALAADLETVRFRTNWFPQAEHGGWYQAAADGTYERYGLKVDISPGGPQVNNMQLLLGGRADIVMLHSSGQILNAIEQGLPIVALASFYQKDPQAILSHPGVGHDSLEDLKGKPILLSQDAHQSFWPWLKQQYGYTDEQVRPYTYQMGPFMTDTSTIQQGYITNEPFTVKQAGLDPNLFLLSDHGWESYSTLMVTTQDILDKNPEMVRKFIEASVEGWYRYLSDPEDTNKVLFSLNDTQVPEQLAYSLSEMDERGILISGDAETQGIGIMTDERWQEIHAQLTSLGLIQGTVDPRKGYTTEFVGTEAILDIMRKYPDVSGLSN